MLTSAEALKTETNVRDGRPGSGQAAKPKVVLRNAPRLARDPRPAARGSSGRRSLESRVSKTVAEDVHDLLTGRASSSAPTPAPSARAEKGGRRTSQTGGDSEGDRGPDSHPGRDPGRRSAGSARAGGVHRRCGRWSRGRRGRRS